MKEYRRGSHSVFQLHIHMVWCTKYRKKVLEKDIGTRLRELCRQICSDMSVEILSGVVAKDHVHVLVSIPPQVSVSKPIQKLKGKSSYKLQREFASLRKQYWGQRMWARGYFACSTGNVTDEMIKDYIQNHSEKDDDFHVEQYFEVRPLAAMWRKLRAGFSLNGTYSAEIKPPTSVGGQLDFVAAQALWNDPDLVEVQATSDSEPRFLMIGCIDNKHWSAVITYRESNIRIISVRRSRKSEVKLYES